MGEQNGRRIIGSYETGDTEIVVSSWFIVLSERLIRLARGGINAFVGFVGGILTSIFGKRRRKPTVEDLKRAEFKTSTQRLGVRFTEKIREVFRFRWLRKF